MRVYISLPTVFFGENLMSFMSAEIHKGQYYSVECNRGETWIVPEFVSGKVKRAGDLQPYVQGKIDNPHEKISLQTGYVGRYSASGYMDCTEWTADTNKRRLEKTLREMYGDEG